MTSALRKAFKKKKNRICFQRNLLNLLGRDSEHKQSAFLFYVKWRDSISPHHRFHQAMQQRTELMYMYREGTKQGPFTPMFTPSLSRRHFILWGKNSSLQAACITKSHNKSSGWCQQAANVLEGWLTLEVLDCSSSPVEMCVMMKNRGMKRSGCRFDSLNNCWGLILLRGHSGF